MVTSMTKSSESHDEGEHHSASSVEQLDHSPDVQAAKLSGASDIKAFQSTNSNLHSGTAGGDAHESIQIVALDERGKERIVAERPKVKPENDHPENFDTSTLLAIEAKTNPVAKVISLFRNWIESLPSGKQKEEYREVSRAQAAELSPEIKDQLERNKQLRGSVEYTHVLNTPSGWMEVGQKISQLSFDDQAKVIGSGLLAGINHYQYEDRERTWGQLIGTVEGLGEVAIGLAKIADFTALLILNDPEKIAQSAAEFRLAFGQTIASGIKLFQASDQYLYNIGFEGDYSKPFRDIQTLGTVLNQRWSQLTPRDQERIKANLITQLSIDGLLGIAWPSMRSVFGMPLDALGQLLMAGTAGYIISSFTVGRMIKRLGMLNLLLVGALLRAGGLAGYALFPEWWMLIGVGFLTGFGGGMVDAGLNTYFAVNFGTRLMNWLHAAFGLGATAGPILMTALVTGGAGWRWGYGITAVLQLVLATAVYIRREEWRLRAAASAPATASEEATPHIHRPYADT